MDLSELKSLIEYDQMPLSDIEAIFRLLIGYPDEGTVTNPTRADLTNALRRACESLVGDTEPMPQKTSEIIRDVASRLGEPGQGDKSYSYGASVVEKHFDMFDRRLLAALENTPAVSE